MSGNVLVIDQGTNSGRAVVFDGEGRVGGMGKMPFTQHYPHPNWVEHVPEEIWATCLWASKMALRRANLTPKDIATIGITNQRETTIVWDRLTGKPIYNAIVWQDRRTVEFCAALRAEGLEPTFAYKTGLVLDPFFSATKIRWLLDNVPDARRRAEAGELAFGTVDCFLIWRLTGGKVHATDATNASRTLLYDIAAHDWDDELLRILDIPRALMPEVRDSSDDFGTTDPAVFGVPIRICGVAGDQQGAVIGQGCLVPGMMKSTYGSSCFALLNTGTDLVRSSNRLLTTVAYRINGQSTYALEGAIFVAGAAVTWLLDGINILDNPAQSDALARQADPDEHVYLVPAFDGLGAPWWDSEARGGIYGLTRNTRRADLVRAALEAVSYQTRDLLDAMRRDWATAENIVLRVDGGMVANDWAMQFLADILDAPVDRSATPETTALGAAWLAGYHAGVWPDAETFFQRWVLERRFEPRMNAQTRSSHLAGWDDAVRRTLRS